MGLIPATTKFFYIALAQSKIILLRKNEFNPKAYNKDERLSLLQFHSVKCICEWRQFCIELTCDSKLAFALSSIVRNA